MLLSYNLLKKYVDLPEGVTPAEVAEKLTMSTVEVEKVIELAKDLENVVVGRIIKIEPHPNADKLKLVWVDIEGENSKSEILNPKQIQNSEFKIQNSIKVVCGATNLKEDMLVALAKVGAMVRWHGEGEPVKLEKAKIRGVESKGMICSANEIGLESIFPYGEMEIVDLSKLSLKVGEPLGEALALSGVIFDIDNKSLTNRPDLWGHYGVAREVAVIFNVKLKELDLFNEPQVQNSKSQIPNSKLKVEIKDKELCPRYLGCVVENVKVKDSPDWLKQELMAIGHNTFNNIVDITNYVLEEVGQPLHAFDLAKLNQKLEETKNNKQATRIIVRKAKKGEPLLTLDNERRELDNEMLVIADSQKPVALAGIMGGLKSGVIKKTKTIILEAANFEAINIRKTSQKLDVRTDSSIRFEKALDPRLAEVGMRRALQLIKEVCPKAQISQVIIEDGEWQKLYPVKSPTSSRGVPKGQFDRARIKISLDFIQKKIGKKIPEREILAILGRLGFEFTAKSGVLFIKVPSWRATGDVDIAEDIVEEIARIYGYNNLEERQELVEMAPPKFQPEYNLEEKAKNYLAMGCGMHEVFNYPWAEEKWLKELELDKGLIEIANPPTEETKYLQPSLMPNLMKNIEDNLRYFDEFKIFELARVFTKKFDKWDKKSEDKLPLQPKSLAGGVVSGKGTQPFLEVKGIIENFKFQISNFKFDFKQTKEHPTFIDDERVLDIMLGKEKIGWMGEVDYTKLNFKNKKVALFEINWEKLVKMPFIVSRYEALPQFPSIERDIAIEVDWQLKWAEVKSELEKIDKLISDIEFLSEYDLNNPPTPRLRRAGKKSLAFRVIYQANRTLKDSEVVRVEKKILDKLGKKFEAELRK